MITRNILANLVGRIWIALVTFLVVPFYIRYVGTEQYGLIGFYFVLLSSVLILEFGLGATITRALAQTSASPDRFHEGRNLARSMEVIYWSISIVVGAGLCIAFGFFQVSWINVETISPGEVTRIFLLMSVSIVFQFPTLFYSSGLIGMERQVLQNLLLIVFTTMRAVGAILLFYWVSSDVMLFFVWQLALGVIQIVVMRWLFWRYIPGNTTPRFDKAQVKSVWRFTSDVGLTGIFTFFLSQLDKLLVMRLLSLSSFAYYSVANSISNATRMGSSSIFAALYPRMARLKAAGEQDQLVKSFHLGCQVVSLTMFPASMIIMAFSYDLILIWTQNQEVASMSWSAAMLLVAGSLFNSLAGIPYDLTLAYGWSRFGLYQNAIASILIVPLVIILINIYGLTGAALAWLILNVGYSFIAVPLILNRIMKSEIRTWIFVDVGRPAVLSAVIVIIGKFVIPTTASSFILILYLALLWLVTCLACSLSLPLIKAFVFEKFVNRK